VWNRRDWKAIIGPWRPWAFEACVTFAGASWMALMGPFGTDRIGLGERFALQFVLAGAVVGLYGLAGRIALTLGRERGWPPWASLAGGALAASLPMSVAVAAVVQRHIPAAAAQPAFLWYVQTVLVILPGLAVYAVLLHFVPARLLGTRPPANPGEPSRLARRLPSALGARVLALEAEDHYVRIHTERGSTLVHMRLADAIGELDGLEGMKIHRSWWVARRAAVGARLKGRQLRMVLCNGVVAPVARTAAPALKDAGWPLQQL
jgi:hypothetical protein